ncbi:KIR protein [Plasmodium coatneyi]|uniref:KIR protein n=1 Tax=Plasmodium coatneyi TaxID=208452 RepID=A0A1B1E2K4_9APIC|nr:KIR protein [Plasmodium coatneyi]ANQ09226.1 KIR protein [Plasmodium coatneyi]
MASVPDGPSSNLVSKQIYDGFQTGKECPAETARPGEFSQVKIGVEGLLGGRTNIPKADANKIVKNYCDACGGINRTERGHYYEPCYLFYYWLGDKIRGNLLENHSLKTVMDAIYQQLEKFPCTNNCTKIYRATSDTLFGGSKKMFEFGYNYEAFKKWKKSEPNACWKEYETHWKEAKTAYESMNTHCESDATCKAFKSKYDTYFKNGEKPTLPCAAMSKEVVASEDQSDGDDEDEDDDDEGDDHLDFLNEDDEEEGNPSLDQLPSRAMYYKRFYGGLNLCNVRDSWPGVVKVKLDEHQDVRSYTEKIVEGLCYVDKMKETGTPPNYNKEYCDFFYFWVGNMLLNKFEDRESFRKAMKAVKDAMQSSYTNHNCSFRFPTRSRKYFKHSKYLFDYYKDKDVINSSVDSGEKNCDKVYYRYLQKAISAYKYMDKKCPGKKKNYWCDEFKIMYEKCKGGQNGGLECKVTSEPEQSCKDWSKLEAGAPFPDEIYPGSNSTITVVASSALAVLGTAFITLFLYKVNAVTVEI